MIAISGKPICKILILVSPSKQNSMPHEIQIFNKVDPMNSKENALSKTWMVMGDFEL